MLKKKNIQQYLQQAMKFNHWLLNTNLIEIIYLMLKLFQLQVMNEYKCRHVLIM